MSRIAKEIGEAHAKAVEVRRGERSRSTWAALRCALTAHFWVNEGNPARSGFKRFCLVCLVSDPPPAAP